MKPASEKRMLAWSRTRFWNFSTGKLGKDVQNYVKTHTAPYKYPRIVVFREDLPKTISGKIQRNRL